MAKGEKTGSSGQCPWAIAALCWGVRWGFLAPKLALLAIWATACKSWAADKLETDMVMMVVMDRQV